MPDRLASARAVLELARLLYRTRVSAARCGVQGAAERAHALVPLGRDLAAAVDEAASATAGSAEHGAALERVGRLGGELWALVDERREGIRGLIAAGLQGVRGEVTQRPGPPVGLGQAGVSAAAQVGPGVVSRARGRKRARSA